MDLLYYKLSEGRELANTIKQTVTKTTKERTSKMKNQETAVNVNAKPESALWTYLEREMRGKQSGVIPLSDITKNVPSLDKYKIVALLKGSKVGKFITGRRGAFSRFSFGEAAQNVPQPQIRRIQKSQGLGFLRVKAGKFIQEIPISSMELIAA